MSATRPGIALAAAKALAPHYSKMESERPVEKYNAKLIVSFLKEIGFIQKKDHLLSDLGDMKDEAKFAGHIQTIDGKDILQPGYMKTFIKTLAHALKADDKLETTLETIKKTAYPDTFEGNFHKILAQLLIDLVEHEHNKKLKMLNDEITASADEIRRLNSELEAIKKERDELDAEANDIDSDAKAIGDELIEKTKINAEKDTKIKELSKELSDLLFVGNQHVAKLITQISQLEKNIEDTEKKHHQQLQKHAATAKGLANTIADLKYQLNELQSQKEAAEAKIKTATDETSQLQKRNDIAEQKITALDKTVDGLNKILTAKNTQEVLHVQELQKKTDTTNELTQTVSELRAEIKKLQAHKEALEKENNTVLQDLGVARTKLKNGQEKIDTLQKEAKNLTKVISAQSSDSKLTASETRLLLAEKDKIIAAQKSVIFDNETEYKKLETHYNLLLTKSKELETENRALKNEAKAKETVKPVEQQYSGFGTPIQTNGDTNSALLSQSLFPLPPKPERRVTRSQTRNMIMNSFSS